MVDQKGVEHPAEQSQKVAAEDTAEGMQTEGVGLMVVQWLLQDHT